MSNNLATVLNDAGGRALVERYLDKRFLERREWETILANTNLLSDRGIPVQDGQFIKLTRLNRFRRPEHVDLTNETADPASGASMATEVIQVPLEFIHEYIELGKIASMTSWIDLEQWADEDLPMALKRRMHELVQNAFIVGRYQPGKYDSNGVATTAFDTTVEKTVTLYGQSFTFQEAPKFYANGRASFADLQPSDRVTWGDIHGAVTRMRLAGATDICMVCSQSVINDLMESDTFFQAAIRGLDQNSLRTWKAPTMYGGVTIKVDDEPFTENFGAENVRASWGPIHSIILTGKNAAAFVNHGNKRTKLKPTFKVQDISKTGKSKTIGYTVPFQAAVLNRAWCAVLKTPVSEYTPNA